MALSDFLATDANLHFREELFNHRLLYDLKLATIAARGYALLTYTCDVDHDGFDVILDDRDLIKKVQLKASYRKSKTASWEIHRTIIRPSPFTMERLGFEVAPTWGVQGGVILIDFDVDDAKRAVDVQYWYADIFTISAIALGMVKRHHKTVKAAEDLRKDLFNKGSNEKINVSEGLFIKAADAQHLLALIGLHSEIPGNWRNEVLRATSGSWEPGSKVKEDEVKYLKEHFIDTMKVVCGQDEP